MKTHVVTGANAGIGKEVALGLMQQGDHVIMACRRDDACQAARADLLSRHPSGSCECRHLDLSDYSSIRTFAADIHSQNPTTQLSTLINNAGVLGVPPGDNRTDLHLRINHFGVYLLTRLLLPAMAPNGRIVTVGSEAHRRATMKLQPAGRDLPGSPPALADATQTGHWYPSYGRSKLGNLLMTAELSRRLQERNSSVTTTCVTPGRVATDIFKNLSGVVGAGVKALAGMFFQTPEQGARGVLLAATSPKFEGKHFLYTDRGVEIEPSRAARDPHLAAALWDISNREVGLSEAEDQELWPKN